MTNKSRSAPRANSRLTVSRTTLHRLLSATLAGLVLVSLTMTVGAWADGGGTHARTTTRLLTAFKDLRADTASTPEDNVDVKGADNKLMTATFGTGCFWCTEAVFEQLEGVQQVASGYSGGYLPNPTYQQVLTKTTGHAEVVQVTYDPETVTYAKLLEVFWFTHDPTTLNRQGVDYGPQYRSVIFYHTKEQKRLAEIYKQKLDKAKAYRDPIVTEITKYSAFYPAENYHQDYFALNGRQPYCRQQIRPKVSKLRKIFQEDLKSSR